jgi:hypothetical protein
VATALIRSAVAAAAAEALIRSAAAAEASIRSAAAVDARAASPGALDDALQRIK